jgi:molecular chaperone IbpA|tara:strand:+ start:678 stop:1139 length:462 start_codon:yes stop_codon:yes gene_type:complete
MLTLAPHTFPTQQDLQKMLGFSVGFDGLFNRLNTMDTAQSGYPPYNIRKINDLQYVVELALAGFSKSDIEVEVTEGTLTIRSTTAKDDGADNDENNEINFVHRGIAKRTFSRAFQLSDDIIVQSADLQDGMLIVNLERVIPDEKKPRLIPIGQ